MMTARLRARRQWLGACLVVLALFGQLVPLKATLAFGRSIAEASLSGAGLSEAQLAEALCDHAAMQASLDIAGDPAASHDHAGDPPTHSTACEIFCALHCSAAALPALAAAMPEIQRLTWRVVSFESRPVAGSRRPSVHLPQSRAPPALA